MSAAVAVPVEPPRRSPRSSAPRTMTVRPRDLASTPSAEILAPVGLMLFVVSSITNPYVPAHWDTTEIQTSLAQGVGRIFILVFLKKLFFLLIRVKYINKRYIHRQFFSSCNVYLDIQLQGVERTAIVAVRTRASNATACRYARRPWLPAARTQCVTV